MRGNSAEPGSSALFFARFAAEVVTPALYVFHDLEVLEMTWPNLENRFATFFAMALDGGDYELAGRFAEITMILHTARENASHGLVLFLDEVECGETGSTDPVPISTLREVAAEMLEVLRIHTSRPDDCLEPTPAYGLSQVGLEIVDEALP